jgi:DNA-binding transcriptional ArsR family regulator
MGKASRSDDDDLLMALRHPLRRRILRAMTTEEDLSPTELAEILDAPLTKVAYHVRVLAECAAVNLVHTQPARGSMEHFYSVAFDAAWAREMLDFSDGDESDRGESSGNSGT